MKPLLIIDASRDGGGRDRGSEFLPVQSLVGVSREELYRQLNWTRSWLAASLIMAALGWLTAGLLIFLVK